MRKLEHLGIAVKNLDASNDLFKRLLGSESYKTESVESEGVTTSFFTVGDTKIELLKGETENSPISKFIEKKGEGIHHIAFKVDNIEEEINRLKKEGFEFVNETPKKGTDNKRICFLHPKSSNGVLIELCEDMD